MKFVCRGLDLSEAISKVTKALPAKSVENPLLSCIKIDAYDNTITLLATDSELAIMKKINAEVIEEGSVAVPGTFLMEFVRRLSDEQIEFALLEQYKMRIRYTGSEVFVQCLDSREYPAFRTLLNPRCVSIMQKELKELILGTVFCVSPDSNRGTLRGCKLEVHENSITSVALDGYRLMKMSRPIENTSESFCAIVPGKSLSEAAKVIESDDETASVYFENDYVLFDFEHTKVLARTLDGEYINYNQIIPKDFVTEVTVNREMLLKSLDRAGVLSKTDVKTSMVHISMQEGLMVLKGNSTLGNITENLNIKFKGKDMKIAFNVKYLIDFLGNCKEEFVKMKFASSIAPCIINPINAGGECDDFYLVLPMRTL